jgi:hypothetical protein
LLETWNWPVYKKTCVRKQREWHFLSVRFSYVV